MKKLKKILIIALVIALIVGILIIIANRNNKKVKVNDYTLAETQATSTTEENRTVQTDEVSYTINKYIKIPTEDDANKINAGITNVTQDSTTGNLILTMDSVAREAFDPYGKGDVFILNGDENTPLKEVYFGKVASKYVDSNSNLIVEVENPTLDEVFDEFHVNTSGVLTEENVKNITLADGVSFKWVDSIETDNSQTSNLDNTTNYQKLDNLNYELKKDFVLEYDAGIEYNYSDNTWTTKNASYVKDEINNSFNFDDFNMEEIYEEDSHVNSKEVEESKNKQKVTEKSTVTEKDTDGVKTTTEKDYERKGVKYYEGDDGKKYNLDNHLIDDDGNLIDDHGNLVDEYGNRINEDGDRIDEKGNVITDSQSLKDISRYNTGESKFKLGFEGTTGFKDIGVKVNLDYSIFHSPHIENLSTTIGGTISDNIEVSAEFNRRNKWKNN